jgi:cell division initiation protein
VSFISPADFRVFAPEQRRGKYEAAEVDDLLAYLAAQYKELWDERAELAERLAAAEREVAEAREQLARHQASEQHVAQALLHVEAIAAELRENAEREAQSLLEEARTMADALLDEAEARADDLVSQRRAERDRLQHEITELAQRRKELKGQYRELLVAALQLVDEDDAGARDEDRAEPQKAANEARVV